MSTDVVLTSDRRVPLPLVSCARFLLLLSSYSGSSEDVIISHFLPVFLRGNMERPHSSPYTRLPDRWEGCSCADYLAVLSFLRGTRIRRDRPGRDEFKGNITIRLLFIRVTGSLWPELRLLLSVRGDCVRAH